MKALVVFYSFTNKTKLVSQTIARELGATLVEIEEVKPRRGWFRVYLAGGFAAVTNRGSKIKPINVDLKQYETIFIGSPNWGSRPAPAVNSFIYQSNFAGKSVIPFITMGGDNSDSALANVIAKIKKSQGQVSGSFAIKTYGLTDADIITKAKDAIKGYLK
ncbi:MAG: flavodoxin [Dehalococcoidales bacterium]|nr:flavodoxin [Dehalococcoidales bacterium]